MKIRVLEIRPQKPPCVKMLLTSIKAFNDAVSIGTNLHCHAKARKLCGNVYIVYAAESECEEFECNRKIGNIIMRGIFYVVAADSDFCPISLTDEEISMYYSMFKDAETFSLEDIIESNFEEIERSLDKLYFDTL